MAKKMQNSGEGSKSPISKWVDDGRADYAAVNKLPKTAKMDKKDKKVATKTTGAVGLNKKGGNGNVPKKDRPKPGKQ